MKPIYVIMMGVSTVVGVVRDLEPFEKSMASLGVRIGPWKKCKKELEGPSGDVVAIIFKAGME